jgi:hypothetical protein
MRPEDKTFYVVRDHVDHNLPAAKHRHENRMLHISDRLARGTLDLCAGAGH